MHQFNLSDTINFLSKLSFARCSNACKILLSYYLSRIISKPIIWCLPVSISVEPTTACNLSCPECPSGLKSFTRATGTIKIDFFKETIDAIHKQLIYLSFYFQGEPFLNKGFLDMVSYASSKGIYTATSTNAHFLTDEVARKTIESGLDRLIISLDGIDQKTYEQYRIGGDIENVLAGAKHIVRWRKELKSKTPLVVFQFLVVKPNEHQVSQVKALAKEIGVDDVWFKTAQIYDFAKDPNNLIPTFDRFSRYRKNKEGETVQKNKLQNHCWKMWHSNVISWDGNIVPCCFDKDAKHLLGNLNKSSLKDIWGDEKYVQFRRDVMQSRKNVDICSNCSEGLKVWSS